MEGKGDLKNALIGVLVGVTSILPGVSGGLIAVLCGVYERLIEDLSDLRHKMFSDFRFLFFLGGGLIVGMMGCAVLLDYTMDAFKAISMALFFGLIVAQIPEINRLSRSEGESDKGVTGKEAVAFLLGLIAVVALLLVDMFGVASIRPEEQTVTNLFLFCICGILLAISKIIPGISGSSLLIALGMFDVTISSMVHLDMFFLVPMCIGIVIGVLGMAKVMNICLKKYRGLTYFAIMGLTVGSLLIIVNELVQMNLGAVDVVLCVVGGAIGMALSYGFTEYGKRLGL